VFPASITMLLTACGSGDLTLNEADPDIVAQKPTWTQVEPIFQRECVPCHAGTDETGDDDDDDARDKRLLAAASSNDPGLESCRSVMNNSEDIISEVFRNNTMPPGAWPRLTSKERLTIERWMATGQAACD
jgi:uncharacterized membrane protein